MDQPLEVCCHINSARARTDMYNHIKTKEVSSLGIIYAIFSDNSDDLDTIQVKFMGLFKKKSRVYREEFSKQFFITSQGNQANSTRKLIWISNGLSLFC